MHSVALYLVKLSICLTVVYLFYYFVLQKLTFYNWNRYYLLLYSLVSFCIPLIDISGMLQKNDLQGALMLKWVPAVSSYGVVANESRPFSSNSILMLLLLVGMLIAAGRLCIQFLSFYRLKKKAALLYTDAITIYQVDENIIPFSFGKSIFINQQLHSTTELQEIIRHEFVHVKQQHSIDIIASELLCVINWYNPFAWLLKNAIRQNLEFIADDKVLQNGISKKSYQYMLLKVTGNNQFSITSQFNFSSLKKRIAMMNKMKTAPPHLMKFLFVVPLLAVMLLVFRNELQSQQTFADTSKQTTRRQTSVADYVLHTMSDTFPAGQEANDKGYLIDIIGRGAKLTVLVSDKNNKEVKRIPMSEWNKKESYYENLYGALPAPPPPPPPPPAPPAPPPPLPGHHSDAALAPTPPLPPTAPLPPMESMSPAPPLPPTPPLPPIAPKLPANVSSINMNNNKATVVLKNGKKETYDLTVPAQKEKFDKQYMPNNMKDSSADQ